MIRSGVKPSDLPASTKSRRFMAIVGARATRANGAVSVIAIAMIRFSKLAPKRTEDQLAKPRSGEDDFSENGIAHQGSKIQADNGDDRDQCVAKSMPDDQFHRPHTLGSRRVDIVLAHDIQHRGTGDTRDIVSPRLSTGRARLRRWLTGSDEARLITGSHCSHRVVKARRKPLLTLAGIACTTSTTNPDNT